MNKKYIVRLTAEQRATLDQRTRTGTTAASVQRHARILLKADAADDGPAIAGGGQEPVEDQAHEDAPSVELNVLTAYFAKSTWPGMRPAALKALEIDCSEVIAAESMGAIAAVLSAAALVMMLVGRPVACAQVAAHAAGWVFAQVCAWLISFR